MLKAEHSAEPGVAPEVCEVSFPGIRSNLALERDRSPGGPGRHTADIGSASDLGAHKSVSLELFIGVGYCVAVYAERFCEVSAGGQAITYIEGAARNHFSHAENDLGVKRHVTFPVKLEYQDFPTSTIDLAH